MEVTKAVIPAAGLGTRLLPATKSQPKEMMPVVDRPAIQYVVEEAVAAGLDDLLIVTGRGKRTLEDHFDRSIELESALEKKKDAENLGLVRAISEGTDIFYIRQKQPLGLGHAVACSRRHIDDEPFAVLLGDDIFVGPVPATRQLIDFWSEHPGGVAIAVQEVPPEKTASYGIADVESDLGQAIKIKSLVEKPQPDEAPSRWAVVGRYVFPAGIFEAIDRTEPDHRGEIQLTDAITLLGSDVPIFGVKVRADRYDVGSTLSYLATNAALALEDPDLGADFRRMMEELLAR